MGSCLLPSPNGSSHTVSHSLRAPGPLLRLSPSPGPSPLPYSPVQPRPGASPAPTSSRKPWAQRQPAPPPSSPALALTVAAPPHFLGCSSALPRGGTLFGQACTTPLLTPTPSLAQVCFLVVRWASLQVGEWFSRGADSAPKGSGLFAGQLSGKTPNTPQDIGHRRNGDTSVSKRPER